MSEVLRETVPAQVLEFAAPDDQFADMLSLKVVDPVGFCITLYEALSWHVLMNVELSSCLLSCRSQSRHSALKLQLHDPSYPVAMTIELSEEPINPKAFSSRLCLPHGD